MSMKNRHFFFRLSYAVRGLFLVVRREKSFQLQLVSMLLALLFAYLLSVGPIWWALLFVVIGLVLVLEVINTAVEMLCDVVQPDYSESIRDIKDMLAGAVLLGSLIASLIGIVMLLFHWQAFISLF